MIASRRAKTHALEYKRSLLSVSGTHVSLKRLHRTIKGEIEALLRAENIGFIFENLDCLGS